MSDCNHCRWQRYKKKGYRIATAADRKKWDDEASERFSSTFGPGTIVVNKDGTFVAWFMELPEHCVC